MPDARVEDRHRERAQKLINERGWPLLRVSILSDASTQFGEEIALLLAQVEAETVERCAQVCDDLAGWRDWAALKHPNFPGAPTEASAAACYLAERIRARGGTP